MNIRELTAVAMLIAGVAMAFTALLMPPPGEIHDSAKLLTISESLKAHFSPFDIEKDRFILCWHL